MKSIMLMALLVAMPITALAQTNTTGTLSPNTTVSQATPSTGTGTTGSGTTTGTGTATSAVPTRDAAIVLCAQEFSTGVGRLLVASASTSSGITAPAPGAPCAQALSDLFVVGFFVLDAQSFNQQLQYTLVR